MKFRRGTIIGMYRERDSGIAVLAIKDDRRGPVLVPCEGAPTARAFDAAFGGVIVGGRFNKAGIEGERIYYTLDEIGVLKSFTPVEGAPAETVEEYERTGKVTVLGYLPPEDRVFSGGPIVAGRRPLDKDN